jgi:deoxyribodipyrimidine photo-lyase
LNKTEIDYRRIRHLNQKPVKDGQVLYWMSRDQRINDNWALLYAQKLAFDYQKPLSVVFCLAPQFLGAILRQYNFMIEGLKELESGFNILNINFYLITGQPEETLTRFCNRRQVGVLVSDFSPLRISRQWKKNVTESLNCASIEVDAHNLVPCWYASPKQEYAAYTFRPKIKKHISGFLGPFPEIIKHPFLLPEKAKKTDWLKIKDKIKAVNSEYGSNSFQTGENAAHKAMEKFYHI